MCVPADLQYTCCFLGHREIYETAELKDQLYNLIEMLITVKRINTFLFGSKSHFNSLCYNLVTEAMAKHPHIKRIYVRAEFPVIAEDYKAYLLKYYEDTYYPASVHGAGKAAYIKRNCEMIDKSHFCVFYYREHSTPQGRNSGTKIAFDYARKRNKQHYTFPR